MIEVYLILNISLVLYSIFFNKMSGLIFSISIMIIFFLVPPDVLILGKYTPATIVLLFTLIGLFAFKSNYKSLLSFPLLKVWLFYVFSLFIIGVSDSEGKLLTNINVTFVYILNNAYPFILFYSVLNKDKHFGQFYKVLLFLFFIICIYGFYNYISQTNPFTSTFASSFKIRDISKDYMLGFDVDRHQISSVFFHPYMYSILLYYFLLYLVLLITVTEKSIILNKNIIFALILLSLFNIYFVGSRTSYVIILLGLFYLLIDSLKSFSKLFIYIPLIIIVLLQVPQVNEMADSIIDFFSSSSTRKTKGSSWEMRQQQFLFSLSYFYKHPLLGNGLYSIVKKIGYTTDLNMRTSDAEAFGFESYLFVILIEQGLLGLIAHILLFYHIIKYHLFNMRLSKGFVKKYIRFNLAFVIGYIVYILGTGTINTLPIFFGLIGLSIAFQKNYCLEKNTI